MTTCHQTLVTRRQIHSAMREVDVDDALQAGRDDKCQMLRTERVIHMTDCDETVQMLTIPMLASEGYMSWQEGNQLTKNCSPK